MSGDLPTELETAHAAQRQAVEGITIGSVIHDGIAISRVTGEGKAGKHPAWKVECVFPFAGQESLVLKESVIAVMEVVS